MIRFISKPGGFDTFKTTILKVLRISLMRQGCLIKTMKNPRKIEIANVNAIAYLSQGSKSALAKKLTGVALAKINPTALVWHVPLVA